MVIPTDSVVGEHDRYSSAMAAVFVWHSVGSTSSEIATMISYGHTDRVVRRGVNHAEPKAPMAVRMQMATTSVDYRFRLPDSGMERKNLRSKVSPSNELNTHTCHSP